MDEPTNFSKRHGFAPPKPEIAVRYEAPDWLRSLLFRLAYEANLKPRILRDVLCDLLLETPDPGNWSEYPNIDNEAQGLLRQAEWFQVYDFAEGIAHELQHRALSPQLQEFTNRLNDAFRRKGVGWQMVDGKIEVRGAESFEKSVRSAITVTQQTGRSVAERELHEALQDLSKRPEPDITGAIQHAMAALECVARDVTGDQNATLGELVKHHPGLLPAPLDTGVAKIWGYASDQARHVREGNSLDIREAELVVGLAGSLATYLVKKVSQE